MFAFTMFRTCRSMRFLLLAVFVSVFMAGCNKDDDASTEPQPAAEEKNRTVLFYMMDDHNLWDEMITSLNRIEKGWNDDIDGTFLVYLDPSPHLTQFTSPVLLRIVHDESDVVRSEVVKSYPEQDPADPEVMRGVLEDAVTLFPARSHGLIIGTHGSAWFPGDLENYVNDPNVGHDEEDHQAEMSLPLGVSTKALLGSERYNNCIEIDALAQLLPVKYDFIMFHACMMGNVETAYALRNKCSYLVGCMAPLPGVGFPYDLIMEYLFAKPQADLYHVAYFSAEWYDTLPEEDFDNFDVSVIRTDKLETLASSTRTMLTKLLIRPEAYFAALTADAKLVDSDMPLYDLKQIMELGYVTNSVEFQQDYAAFEAALEATVVQQWSAVRDEDPELLPHEQYGGLSCYVPLRASNFAPLNAYYKTHYEWGAASGFDQFILSE